MLPVLSGHAKLKSECLITTTRQVSAVNRPDLKIEAAASSDAACVLLSNKGDIFLLHKYEVKTNCHRCSNVQKIMVSGGRLDEDSMQLANWTKLGNVPELAVAVRTKDGCF